MLQEQWKNKGNNLMKVSVISRVASAISVAILVQLMMITHSAYAQSLDDYYWQGYREGAISARYDYQQGYPYGHGIPFDTNSNVCQADSNEDCYYIAGFIDGYRKVYYCEFIAAGTCA